jgi:flagellar basal-body rod protein FlgG
MIKALSTAATGLQAQNANIDRVANDMANVNTDAYKKSRNEFQDLMYETIREPGAITGTSSQAPVGVQTGMGVKVGAQHKIFEQGSARITNHPYDLMIEGKGFFPVQKANGEIGYTRAGNFHPDSQGRLSLASGALLVPNIQIPQNALGFTIAPNGEVKVQLPNNGEQVLGQIQLVGFINDQGLGANGDGLYRPTPASGPPIQGIPGEDGMGAIQQGALESSNVNVANSMVEMIQAQRAFELNTKVMKAADEMLGATAGLRQ